jgi:hypothetical protein
LVPKTFINKALGIVRILVIEPARERAWCVGTKAVGNISYLISKDFLKLVFIAILIAIPIAWFTMYKWLEDFPYRIQIRGWMFALVAMTAIVISLWYNARFNSLLDRWLLRSPSQYRRIASK